MSFPIPFRFVCMIAAFSPSFASDALSGCAIAAQIQIHLKETAVVHGSRIPLSAIATVSCSDPVRKREAEEVEVRLMNSALASETISQRFINIRLIIAGFRMEDLTFPGADQTVVVFQPTQKLTDTQVEEQALIVMTQAMNVEPEDLMVLLQSGFVQSLPKNLLNDTEFRKSGRDDDGFKRDNTGIQVTTARPGPGNRACG